MNRPYSRERFKQLVGDLRSVVPDMYFSTDIIVGFPGETDQDFELTRNLFEEIGFEMAFIFKYSTRTGTPAAILEDQIPKEVKEERNQILLSILEKASLKRNQNLIGTTQEILVEGPARKGENMFVGRNRGFRKVVFSGSERLIGELVPVKIEEASVTTVRGSLVIQ
jgi:tRNA-2-methylthio-N6-dimethylallyladenosine synthase